MGIVAKEFIENLYVSHRAYRPPQAEPQASPIRDRWQGNGFLAIGLIRTILRELFHGVVIGKYVAMNAAQQRDRNFQNGSKEMIAGLADRRTAHAVTKI